MNSKSTTTNFSAKVAILADIWLNYRDDPDFIDFYDYNDVGLPLAYILENKIANLNPTAEALIVETFDSLLEALEVTDTGFQDLDDLMKGAN